MSRSRPMLAAVASITLLLVALSTTLAVSSRTGGAAGLAADGDLLAADAIGHVVVSELMTGGASASDELIELYNPSAAALPLEGLEVIYVTATGGTITRKASWAAGAPSMPAGAHVLIANAAGVFGQIADITYTNGLAAAGGSVAIRIIGASSAIDAAGWGTAANAWMEGTAAVAAAAGHSLERLPGGTAGSGQDTDQNSADFVERDTPDPQGSGSPPIPVSTPQPTTTPAASPSAAQTTMPTPGATSTPSPTSTPAPSATPIASPSASPTPSPQPATPSPSPDATPTATPMTIATARAMADGASVVVEGVSLADGTFSDGGGYLADATGGIAVLVSGGIFPRGTALRVQGELDQRFSQRTIRASATNVTILGPGSEPTAAPATTGSIGEGSEGELVEIEGTIVSSQTTLTTGIAIDLDDGSGPIRVMVGTATGVDTTTWLRDTRLHLRGVVGQRDSSGSGTAGYRVQPRDPGDVLDVTPPATPSPTPSAAPSATPLPSPGPSVVSIAAARAAAVNARLTVRGVITLPSGLAEVGEAAIQDSSGAILLRLGDEAGSLALGDLVEVSGTRSTSAGMETIRVATPARRLGNRTQPASVRRATGELGEAQEAMLVVTRGAVTVTPRRTSAQNVYFDIDDGSGPIRVFVSPRAGIQTDAILMGSVLEIGGVLGQETTGKLPDRGYRLWPRGPSDLDVVSAAPAATPGGAPGGGSGGQSAGGDDGPVGGSSHGGQPVGPVASNPPRQQHVPRLEAPAPTAALPSAIPGSDAGPGPTATEAPQPEGSNPEPASAAMLVLAALLLGGGGVAAAPPGLVHRLRVALRQRLGNGFATPDADEMPPTAALGGAPGLVPLSVVADGPERAGRILPPT